MTPNERKRTHENMRRATREAHAYFSQVEGASFQKVRPYFYSRLYKLWHRAILDPRRYGNLPCWYYFFHRLGEIRPIPMRHIPEFKKGGLESDEGWSQS